METIENKDSQGIPYKIIGEKYAYTPIAADDSLKKIDLSIDWKEHESAIWFQQYEAMKCFDTCHLERAPNGRYQAILSDMEIPSSQGILHLVTAKRTSPEEEKTYLRIKLEDRIHNELANIYVRKEQDDTWNIADRIVPIPWRSQGIGSHLISATENCIQSYADSSENDQEIIMNAGQLSVLSLFLRNGYEIIEKDQEKFQNVIERLKAGDPTFMLASNPRDPEGSWYVFEKTVYEQYGERMWNDTNPVTDRPYYFSESVRFTLRKKISANKKEVPEIQNGIREQISEMQ